MTGSILHVASSLRAAPSLALVLVLFVALVVAACSTDTGGGGAADNTGGVDAVADGSGAADGGGDVGGGGGVDAVADGSDAGGGDTGGDAAASDDVATADAAADASAGEATFAAVYKDLIVGEGCSSAYCHGAMWKDEDSTYSDLTTRSTNVPKCASSKLVTAGDPAASLLFLKIDGASAHGCGSKMPPTSKTGALAANVALVKAWILGGAKR